MFLPWLFGRGFCPLLGVTAHKGLTLFSFLVFVHSYGFGLCGWRFDSVEGCWGHWGA